MTLPVQGKHSLQMMRVEFSLKVTPWRADGVPFRGLKHNSAGSIPHTPNQKKKKVTLKKKNYQTPNVWQLELHVLATTPSIVILLG